MFFENKKLYNGGSEWQNVFINLPDYVQTFYRNYDPAIGRFIGTDPSPESAESFSNYHYSGANPVMFNDPLGDKVVPPGPSGPGIVLKDGAVAKFNADIAAFLDGSVSDNSNNAGGISESGGAGGSGDREWLPKAINYANKIEFDKLPQP